MAEKVTRRFGGLVAVNEVDFTIPEGSIVSLIGPNGAGKTTFFNVLLGIIDPTAGRVEFNGRAMIARPRRVGLESLVWVAPSIFIILVSLALGVTGVLAGGGIALAGVAAIGFLIGTLLLAIVRPLWYQMFLLRLGIFRSARPNDMVAGRRRPHLPEHPPLQEHDGRGERAHRHALPDAFEPRGRLPQHAAGAPGGGPAAIARPRSS